MGKKSRQTRVAAAIAGNVKELERVTLEQLAGTLERASGTMRWLLAAVAAVSERLRISAFVLNNDLRHPAVLAQELASLDVLSEGRARRIEKPGQVFSRIHVDDIAAVLLASIDKPNPGAAYNVCDDNPAPPDEVIAYAAELLGVEPPPAVPFEQAQLSEMARSFYADNKRVRNNRIKNELGVRLKYPDYRAGLQAILAESN